MGNECKSEAGFTFLELMFGLATTMIIIMFVPSLFRLVLVEKTVQPYELEVFYQQLGADIREAQSITTNGRQFILDMPNGSQVLVEQYQDVIRRRVNMSGHEVMLQHVQSVMFTIENHGVVIKITDRDGLIHQRRFSKAPLNWAMIG